MNIEVKNMGKEYGTLGWLKNKLQNEEILIKNEAIYLGDLCIARINNYSYKPENWNIDYGNYYMSNDEWATEATCRKIEEIVEQLKVVLQKEIARDDKKNNFDVKIK